MQWYCSAYDSYISYEMSLIFGKIRAGFAKNGADSGKIIALYFGIANNT